jgi:hypothetical protein
MGGGLTHHDDTNSIPRVRTRVRASGKGSDERAASRCSERDGKRMDEIGRRSREEEKSIIILLPTLARLFFVS